MRHALCHQLFQVRRHTLLWQERDRPKGADAYTAVFLKLVSCAFHFNILPGGNIHAHPKTCRGTCLHDRRRSQIDELNVNPK